MKAITFIVILHNWINQIYLLAISRFMMTLTALNHKLYSASDFMSSVIHSK